MKFNFNNFDVEMSFDEIFSEHPQDIKDFLVMLKDLDKDKKLDFDIELLLLNPIDNIETNLILDNHFDDGFSGDYNENIEDALRKLIEDFEEGNYDE